MGEPHDCPHSNQWPWPYKQIEESRELAREAKSCGLAVVVWAYPRGGSLSKEGETAIDVVAYAAHMAALLGAHIIKVKVPTDHLERDDACPAYVINAVDISTLTIRVGHVVSSVFEGRRIVLFSGGASKSMDEMMSEVRAIRDGGGNGSIIGRNTFQRPRQEALDMLGRIIAIYREEE